MMRKNISDEVQLNEEMLNEAFKAFSVTSTKFQDAYAHLEERVGYLSQELAEKNQILHHKVIEIDRMHKYVNSILENISDGVIALNLDGCITTFNKAAQDITHYSAAEMLQKHYSEIFSAGGQQKKGRSRHIVDALSFPTGKEMTIKSKLREEIPIVAFTSVITDDDANVKGLVITFNDLSKIKELENEVDRSKRLAALGEMAAGVAHEIRNPLGGIEMFASLLARKCKDDPERENIAQHIVQGVRSLNKIITEMLTFTQSLENTQFNTVNIIECIESALGFAQHEICEKDISIKKRYSLNDPIYISGDSDHLRQVFLNIILNAVQAIGHKKGSVEIACVCYDGDGYAIVEITDNGGGIDTPSVKKIFDPFFTTKSNGTGLGLAVSYRIIQAHSGKISVRSRKGKGTTFSIYVPASRKYSENSQSVY